MKTKKELRNEILYIRDELSQEERKRKSEKITKQVITRKEFIEADKVLLFASLKSEVDTTEIYQAAQKLHKNIYYPKVVDKTMEFYQVQSLAALQTGAYGISEPEANRDKLFQPKETDRVLVIMPGVVFDIEGNRIGYGGGYYDKFLQKLAGLLKRENICKLAVAYECQIVAPNSICKEEFDVKPDIIVTEERTVVI